jgi:membrane protein required for colicin V production
MEGFTIVDGVVAGVVLISAILAYSRGLVREILAIVGWVVAAAVAFVFAADAEPLVQEIPVIRDLIDGSCELSILTSFAAVFGVALIVVTVFTPIFAGAVQRSAIGGIDQGLGFLFGVARGVLLVAVAFILYDRIVPEDQGMAIVADSQSRAIMASTQEKLEEMVPTEAPQWIVGKYTELTNSCAAAQPTSSGTSGA